jgi:Flp pilus assembly pilin Flp
LLNRIILRLRSQIGRFMADERGSATEYIMIAGLAVIVLGAAVVTWNEGLVDYLEDMLSDLEGLGE